MDLDRYRAAAERFLGGSAAAGGDEVRHLFTREAVRDLRAQRDATPAGTDGQRRLRHLTAFAAAGHLSAAAKEESDRVAKACATLTVAFQGNSCMYRDMPGIIAGEGDWSRRGALYNSWTSVAVYAVNPLLRPPLLKWYQAAHELGYTGYVSLFEDAKGVDYAALAQQCKGFLRDTASLYRSELERQLKRIRVAPSQAHQHDLLRVMRGKEYDSFFPESKVRDALEDTLIGMGLDPGAARAGAGAQAACPAGNASHPGLETAHAVFHTAGHALHAANTTQTEFEFRRLGDNAVGEGCGSLVEYLLTDRLWVWERLHFVDDRVLRFAYFRKLYLLRRLAARVIYELELHGVSEQERPVELPAAAGAAAGAGAAGTMVAYGPAGLPLKVQADDACSPTAHWVMANENMGTRLDAMGSRYSEIMGDALMAEHPKHHFLTDVTPGFAAADSLRGWMLAARVRGKLQAQEGRRWWTADAARALRDLWSSGQKYSADELARQFTGDSLDMAPLAEEITQGLK